MKKKDFLWLLSLAFVVFFLVYPITHEIFVNATKAHPYLMGFVKVSILASLGELLAIRISIGEFKKPKGMLYRFVIWGLIGMSFVLIFDLFAIGVGGVMKKGLLPYIADNSFSSQLLTAFLISLLMNFIFAPTFMCLHRITDTYIDLGNGVLSNIFKVKLLDVVKKIDWYGFLSFIVIKTIPLFWVPAHTFTFMLPPEYRVICAAFLSIALGAMLSFAKRETNKPNITAKA